MGVVRLYYEGLALFMRLIEPDHHLEAITWRPLLLHAVGKQIQHAGHKIIQVCSNHAKFKSIQQALSDLSRFFKTLKSYAEQMSIKERMRQVLNRAFKKFVEPGLDNPPKLHPEPG